jgi:hypothetical protein
MARPGVDEQKTEANLMVAHGKTQCAIEAVGAAAGIVRQIYHRWPATIGYLDKIDSFLAEAIDCATDAQVHVKAEITRGQARRRVKNNGTRRTKSG